MCFLRSSTLQSPCVVTSPIDAPHPMPEASGVKTQAGKPRLMIWHAVGRNENHQCRSSLLAEDKEITASKFPWHSLRPCPYFAPVGDNVGAHNLRLEKWTQRTNEQSHVAKRH